MDEVLADRHLDDRPITLGMSTKRGEFGLSSSVIAIR